MATTPRKLFGTRAAAAVRTGAEELVVRQSSAIVVTPYGLPVVRAATVAALAANTRTGNVLTADANGALAAIDGVSLSVGERVLVKNESTAAKNGVYTVTSLGGVSSKWSLTRASDADASAKVQGGLRWYVLEGSANAGSEWVLTNPAAITLNSTALDFAALSRTGVTAVERYDPDREPPTGLSASHSDNFKRDTSQLSWRWGNQGGASVTNARDRLVFTGKTGGTSAAARWIDAPSAVDFAVFSRLHFGLPANNASAGLAILDAGSESTPTSVRVIRVYMATNSVIACSTMGGYNATGSSNEMAWNYVNQALAGEGVILAYWYVASTKSLKARFSWGGGPWIGHDYTLVNHPISLGFWTDPIGSGQAPVLEAEWIRCFTAGAGASANQLTGGKCGA